MKTKIVPISDEFFPGSKKQRALSQPMIAALVTACARQKEGLPFGPGDIKRSFIPLIKRGLIVRNKGDMHDKNVSWRVTREAIAMLKDIGIDAFP